MINPASTLAPVTVNDTVVVLVGKYDMIIAWETCKLVTYPLNARLTVAPLVVVAVTVVVERVDVGEGVGVGEEPA